ncbi:failed axon connections homolog isoform X2 [Folsomia candida]|uniref:failed axon connections homolog isoform X2 n=1 Tax=Folsomia candida TaxID=158441 RepID=UPI000B8FA445|nr:failed axon connections homolog isoform X2 [Folsomia candida]
MGGGLGLNRFIRENVHEMLIDCFDILLFSTICVFVLLKLLPLYFVHKARRGIKAKWSTSPKDVVILHTTPRGVLTPCISPFALKLETYLRMAKIPYKFDGEFPFGKKAKTPWITLNGKHIADSQLIIETLNKKFEVKLGNYNETERAYGRATRIMIDEHMYWGGVVWRFSYCDQKVLKAMYKPLFKKYNWIMREFLWRGVVSKMRGLAWAQGTGRHSYEEIVSTMNESTFALSKILGNKKFILGDLPSEDDAAIFGLLAQALYSSPGAPFHDAFDKCPNLVEYTNRMKELYWPDWDDNLAKP